MSVFTPRVRIVVQALFDDRVTSVDGAAFELTSPRRVEIQRNAARKADKCTITFAYRDMPLDPRLFSSLHVAVFMADEDLVPATPPNLRFIGIGDAPESTLNMAEGTIRIECRDYTALALDRPWRRVADAERIGETKKTRIRIRAGQTLGQFATEWKRRIQPDGADTSVSIAPLVFEDPVLATLRLDRVASGSLLAMGKNDTAWDVLTRVCEWFALVPVWELDPVIGPVLRIRTPSSRTGRAARLSFGRDATELRIARNLQGPDLKQVRIVAWNPQLARAFAADFPTDVATLRRLDEGGASTPTDRTVNARRVQYNLYGDYDLALVRQIARTVYEDQARRRLTGTIRTRQMVDADDRDILSLGNGDVLTTQIQPTTVHGLDNLSVTQIAQRLADPRRPNALPPDAAQAVAQNYARMRQLAVDFYVTEASHVWDHRDGYAATINFSDFIAGL